jgi:hypothetical protein
VAIDSVNPALVDGAAGEAEIAAFVARWLGERGGASSGPSSRRAAAPPTARARISGST